MFCVNDDWKRHEIIDPDDRQDWFMEKWNRGKRQRENDNPDLRSHFWIEDEGKIIDFWFNGYTAICDKLNIKKVMYHKPHNKKIQNTMIKKFAEDFTPRHKELIKKYWKTTSNKCDYNACAYKLRHPSAKIIYGEMGFGDEVKYSAFDEKHIDKRSYEMAMLLKKQFPNDYEKCRITFEWFVNEADNSISKNENPVPFPNKKKRKKKKKNSHRRRQNKNKLKKGKICDYDAVALFPL